MIKAIRVIKELFGLPDDAEPKWYVECDISEYGERNFPLPSESLVTVLHNDGQKI